jgi:fibronectin type 3 domain-containing protein
MRRTVVALCMIFTAGGCVNLGKPEKVAECSATNSCKNEPKVADGGLSGIDADANPFIEGQTRADADTRAAALDGAQTGDDVPGTNDDGPLIGDDTGPVVGPDVPDFVPDTAVTPPDDTGPIIPPDLPSDPGTTTEPPIVVIPDAAADTRDAPAAPDLLPDVRDVARDVPVGVCAPGGVVRPAGTSCRAAVGPCDVEETCDGVNADCPEDKLAAAGKECRAGVPGGCDIAETCSGTSPDCPADGFAQAGTVCRAAVAGGCDIAESCTGTSATCPNDAVATSATVCRASTDVNKCDPAENCTGLSTTCPSDVAYTQPAVPGTPSATGGTLQATIAWSAATGATGYNVKRSSTSGSGYTTLGSSPTTGNTSYVDTGLAAGTYYYVVSSINTISTCESANSSQVSATSVGPCTPPAAPSITATPGNNVVTLAWAAVSGATSYSVARSLTSGTGYATVATVTTGTGYTDTNVVNGTTYYYVVTSSNGTCSSGNSNEASASPACTPPAAPAGLTPTAGNGSVTLNWTASTSAISYSIYRNTDGSTTYTLVNSTTQTTFTDTNVVNGTKYYYVVTASNGSCSSANSTQVSVTPNCIPPSAPTNVTATAGNNQVTLSWTAPAGAISYKVYRGTSSGGESSTPLASPTTTNYVDTGAANGTRYYYVVTASNGSCSSGNSAEVSATPVCTPPSVPSALIATAGDGQVSLSWGASTPTPTSYTVQRKTGAGGTYATIATPTVNSYSDTGLANGTTYYYQVSAYNGTCSSAYSAEAPATPVAACNQGAPGTPTATITTSTQVKLDWTAASPVPTGGYDIGRSLSSGSGYTNVGHVGNTTLTFTDADSTLAIGTTYYYEITANGSCTATSSPVSIAFTCSTPAVPSPTAVNSSGSITISWTAVTGATAYTVYRSTSSGGTYTAISSNQTAATYTDPASGLTNGNMYYYKVSSSNANHQCVSAQSGAVSATSCVPLAAPGGLSRTVGTSGTVVVNWNTVTGASGYNVLRSGTSGGGYAQVGTVSSNTGTYTDTGLTNDANYYYVVQTRVGNGTCYSTNSSELRGIPRACQVFANSINQITFNTTNPYCFVTCADLAQGNWQCSSWDQSLRTLTANGTAVTCGGVLPGKANSAFTFRIGSGGHTWDAMNWWGAAHDCP